MEEPIEKRGPIEKGKKGWPINKFGLVVLGIFLIIFIFFAARPFFNQKVSKKEFTTGTLISPAAGQIVREATIPIELKLDDTKDVAYVEFWAKAYVSDKWEMIGKIEAAPYKLEWTIPENYRNKAIVVTSNVYSNKGEVVKDPGGWREGIIILQP